MSFALTQSSPMIMTALPLPQVMPPQQKQHLSSIWTRESTPRSACHQAEELPRSS